MNNDSEEPRFHLIQPLRDPQSNWSVDLAKNLEEYLLKICSGEVTGDEDDHLSVNFAEAALLIQGSVQVYSRKVEYLYTLVLHALEFLSQKRQQDQTEQTSVQPERSESQGVADEEDEPFLGLDDVPVEAKICLDGGHSKDDTLNQFVKPPANLVVLEGDCFDSIGDVGELESYLLATHDLYQDFILLDPCDAGAVNNFIKEDNACRQNNVLYRGSSLRSKTHKSPFASPTRRTGGTAYKSPLGKTQEGNLIRTPEINHNVEVNENNLWPDPFAACDFPENDYYEDGINDGYPEPMDESDDDDDPWKPLNPHEPGNLKIKPFKKVKNIRRQKRSSTKVMSLASEFPVARLHGTISPELKEMWEAQFHASKRLREAQSPSLYEKLRQSLGIGEKESWNAFTNPEEENDANEDDYDFPDFGQADFMPESTFMDAEEASLGHEKQGGDGVHFGNNEGFEPEDPNCDANLEDLCRSHLDALLASIAETQKQTELAARVSTWKQGIESTLEEQDSRPPFDIHEYGERVLNKLSLEAESGRDISFADVVRGQEKHDVARTFSALLQLVNNKSVDLDRGECSGQSVCYTAVNPFCLRLLTHENKREEGQLGSSRKRLGKHRFEGSRDKPIGETLHPVSSSFEFTSSVKSSQLNGNFCVKLGKIAAIRCTPEGKRRRRSRLVEPVDLHS